MNDLVKKYIEDIDPNTTLDVVCSHVANGGTVQEYCENLDIDYGTMMKFLNQGGCRERYDQALDSRKSWLKERALREYQAIAFVNMREFYDENGNPRQMDELPEEITRAISSIKKVIKDDEETVEIKFHDKVKGLDAIIKYGAEFTPPQKVDVGGSTLEALLTKSFEGETE